MPRHVSRADLTHILFEVDGESLDFQAQHAARAERDAGDAQEQRSSIREADSAVGLARDDLELAYGRVNEPSEETFVSLVRDAAPACLPRVLCFPEIPVVVKVGSL